MFMCVFLNKSCHGDGCRVYGRSADTRLVEKRGDVPSLSILPHVRVHLFV